MTFELRLRNETGHVGRNISDRNTIHPITRTSQCSWLGTMAVWGKVTEDESEVWEGPDNIRTLGFL